MIYVHILTYDYKATRAARRISLWVYLSSVYIGKAHWISSVLLRRSPRLSKEVRPKPNLNYDVGRQPRRYRSDIKIPHENGRETKYRLSMGVLLMSAESTFVRSAETKRISSRPSLRRPFPPALPVPGTSTDTISAKRVLGRLATRFWGRIQSKKRNRSTKRRVRVQYTFYPVRTYKLSFSSLIAFDVIVFRFPSLDLPRSVSSHFLSSIFENTVFSGPAAIRCFFFF